MRGALAVLSVMLLVSVLVLSQVVPGPSEPPPIPAAVIAKPSIESIAQFEFVPPMWGMPDAAAWRYMEIGMFSIAPATSFTTDLPFYTSVDGPSVTHGVERRISPSRRSDPPSSIPLTASASPPEEVPAGVTVSIGPNDALVYSAEETATGSNSGSESALVVYGLGGIGGRNASWLGICALQTFPSLCLKFANPISVPTKGATVMLQRLELAPFDTFVFEPGADLRYLSIDRPLPDTWTAHRRGRPGRDSFPNLTRKESTGARNCAISSQGRTRSSTLATRRRRSTSWWSSQHRWRPPRHPEATAVTRGATTTAVILALLTGFVLGQFGILATRPGDAASRRIERLAPGTGNGALVL